MPPGPTPDSLTLADVRAAATRIEGRVLRTPVLRRVMRGAELLCKAESLQPTGAFKLRGAFSLMTTLPPGTPGVVSCLLGSLKGGVTLGSLCTNEPHPAQPENPVSS